MGFAERLCIIVINTETHTQYYFAYTKSDH
jgi:hypothetical protein